MAGEEQGRIDSAERAYREAGNAFYALEGRARREVGENTPLEVPPGFGRTFGIASVAVSDLLALSEEGRAKFAKRRPTIREAVLPTAKLCVERYFVHGDQRFDRDDYEQLARVCYAAEYLVREGIR